MVGVTMNHLTQTDLEQPVATQNPSGVSQVLLVCEHAGSHIPEYYQNLGLHADILESHVAWDPGALDLANALSKKLDAPLVYGTWSRLLYDCNRPPDAADAIRDDTEFGEVPGNLNLPEAQRAARVKSIHDTFHASLSDTVAQRARTVLVTIHSFTPVIAGKPRDMDIGVLHDADSRLADALLGDTVLTKGLTVRRNEPYGPSDGVTYTLKTHALPRGDLNVMLEIRNDLLRTPDQITQMSTLLSRWLTQSLATLEVSG